MITLNNGGGGGSDPTKLPLAGGALTGALQWTGTQTSAGASIANTFRDSSGNLHSNVSSSSQVSIDINNVNNFNFNSYGMQFVVTQSGSAFSYNIARIGTTLQTNVPTGATVDSSVNSVVVQSVSSTKVTQTVPLELSTNGYGSSSAVYFGKDANGAVINVGVSGGGGGIQCFSGGALWIQLNETYGAVLYAAGTYASSLNQVVGTSIGTTIGSTAGRANRSKVPITSVGTTFTTIASLAGVIQALIVVNVCINGSTGKGSTTLAWDGTTLTQVNTSDATLVVAGSAAAGQTAFRVSAGNLQAVVDASTRNVSCNLVMSVG